MWGHLIASMNHSQIAPVQQLDSGCWCLPGEGARPGWARLWGDEGRCSLCQESWQGSWPDHWPLLFPQPAAPRLPLVAQNSPTATWLSYLLGGQGVERKQLPQTWPPPLLVILPGSLLPPLAAFPCFFSQHPLGLALSAVVFFFLPLPVCLLSLGH